MENFGREPTSKIRRKDKHFFFIQPKKINICHFFFIFAKKTKKSTFCVNFPTSTLRILPFHFFPTPHSQQKNEKKKREKRKIGLGFLGINYQNIQYNVYNQTQTPEKQCTANNIQIGAMAVISPHERFLQI